MRPRGQCVLGLMLCHPWGMNIGRKVIWWLVFFISLICHQRGDAQKVWSYSFCFLFCLLNMSASAGYREIFTQKRLLFLLLSCSSCLSFNRVFYIWSTCFPLNRTWLTSQIQTTGGKQEAGYMNSCASQRPGRKQRALKEGNFQQVWKRDYF